MPGALLTRERFGAPARLLRPGLAALALALAAPAGAGDLSGRADLGYAQDHANAASREYLRQLYQLTFRRRLFDPTTLQLSARFQADRGEDVVAGVERPLAARTFSPTASLDHRLEDFGVSLAYRRNVEGSEVPDTGRWVSRAIDRYSANVFFRPFGGGEFVLGTDRLSFSASRVDTRDDRVSLSFRYTGARLKLINDLRLQRAQDLNAGTSRTSMGPRVSGTYSRASGDRYTLLVRYLVDYFLTEQKTLSAATGTVDRELQPAGGLFLYDDLPIDTPPMLREPRLVDRVFEQSAGVSLGPGGSSFQNVGLDMGLFVGVDQLRIHVRDVFGVPVPYGSSVTWTVYSSPDGLRWTPVDGALSRYDPELSAYVIQFPATNGRHFKAVNFGVNTISTEVTELQAFVAEPFRPKQTQLSTALRQGLGLNATWRPWRPVLLTYAGVANTDMNAPQGAPRRWSSDLSNFLSANVGPHRSLLYTVSYSQMLSRSPGSLSLDTGATTAGVRYQPLETFDASLEARHTSDRIRREFPALVTETSTIGGTLSTRADVYDSLRLFASAGVSRQDITRGGSTTYLTTSGGVSTEVRRDVTARLEASAQRTVDERGDTSAHDAEPLTRITTYELYALDVRWNVSSQLQLGARVGFAASETSSGWIQNYRASWMPFPGGAIQLAFDYSEDLDPLSGQRFRRASANPRWNINRQTALLLTYNMVRGYGAMPVDQESLFLSLGVYF